MPDLLKHAGLPARLSRALRDILRWRDADKCAFVATISVTFGLYYWWMAFQLQEHPTWLPYFSRSFAAWGAGLLGIIVPAWGVMLALCIALRNQDWARRPLVHLTIQFYSVGNAVLAYAMGPVTNPVVGVVFVGATVVALILFDVWSVLLAAGSGAVILLGTAIAERMGLLPYAPLLMVQPLEGGRPNDWWVKFMGGISLATALLLIGLVAYIVSELRRREALLEELSNVDALTQVPSRRRFFDILGQECARAQRAGRPLSLLMCDVDYFKKVNDTFGHGAGDEVLRGIGRVLLESVRAGTDTPARVGGEEFAVLLAETGPEGAQVIASRIAEGVRALSFTYDEVTFQVTISIGAVSSGGPSADPDALVEASDSLLYRAKASGRNRTVAAQIEELRKA